MFADFARQTAKGTPLYSQLAAGVAANPDLAGLLLVAPVQQRLPVLLFACVHSLVLDEPDSELARSTRTSPATAVAAGDPVVGVRAVLRRPPRGARPSCSRPGTRRPTRSAGRRCSSRASASIERETGPLAHVDVGASAGLNLLIPHYDFVYEPGGSIETGSTVRLTCGTRGARAGAGRRSDDRRRDRHRPVPDRRRPIPPRPGGSRPASGRTRSSASSGCERRSRSPPTWASTSGRATPSVTWPAVVAEVGRVRPPGRHHDLGDELPLAGRARGVRRRARPDRRRRPTCRSCTPRARRCAPSCPGSRRRPAPTSRRPWSS